MKKSELENVKKLVSNFYEVRGKSGKSRHVIGSDPEIRIKHFSRVLEIFKDIYDPNIEDTMLQVYRLCNKENLWFMGEKFYKDKKLFVRAFWNFMNCSRKELEKLIKQLEDHK